jgi:hypothetical protein
MQLLVMTPAITKTPVRVQTVTSVRLPNGLLSKAVLILHGQLKKAA